jgi:hypothetical protein
MVDWMIFNSRNQRRGNIYAPLVGLLMTACELPKSNITESPRCVLDTTAACDATNTNIKDPPAEENNETESSQSESGTPVVKDYAMFVNNSGGTIVLASYDSSTGVLTPVHESPWTRKHRLEVYPRSLDPSHLIDYAPGQAQLSVSRLKSRVVGGALPSTVDTDSVTYSAPSGGIYSFQISAAKKAVSVFTLNWGVNNSYHVVNFNDSGQTSFSTATSTLTGNSGQSGAISQDSFFFFTDHFTHRAYMHRLDDALMITADPAVVTDICANDVVPGGYPTASFVHPTMPVFYQTSTYADRVGSFAIDATTGALSFISRVITIDRVNTVIFPPTGTFAVVGHGSNGLGFAVHQVDSSTGALMSPQFSSSNTTAPLSGARFDLAGKYLFLLKSSTKRLHRVEFDPVTGYVIDEQELQGLGDVTATPVFFKTTDLVYDLK